MFTVVGILSIIAGVFVFMQSTAIVSLETMANAINNSNNNIGGMFAIVAVSLLIARALSCANKQGEKRGFVKASATLYTVSILAALTNFSVGDMKIWAFACGIAAVVYFTWLRRNPA